MDLATENVVLPTMAKFNSSTENVTATLTNNNNQLIMDEESFTPIQKFYDNCNIFVTGGTGFLGKSKLIISFFHRPFSHVCAHVSVSTSQKKKK